MPGPTRIVLGRPKTFPTCSYLGYKAVHGGAAFRRLVELRAQGRIAKVGVSAYTPEEVAMQAKAHLGRHTGRPCAQLMTDRPIARTRLQVLALLADRDVDHIQLPFNLLDGRWKTPAFRAAAAARPDVMIHTRSTFLQVRNVLLHLLICAVVWCIKSAVP